MKTKLLMLLMLLAIFASCSKDEYKDSMNEPEINVVDNQQVLQNNLNLLTTGIIGVSDNLEFRDIVLSEANKTFDGEYNVLLSTVIEKCKANGVNLSSSVNTYYKSRGLEANFDDLVASFADFRGMSFFPHIYVPVLSNESKKAAILKSASVLPVVVTDVIDENIQGAIAGNLKGLKATIEVDEVFASNNEVWVVALNERVNEIGELEVDAEYVQDKQLKAGRSVKLDAIYAQNLDAIEGWTNGGPELNLKIWSQNQHNTIMPSKSYQCSRSQIKKKWFTVNSNLGDWDYGTHGDFLYMWFWENDSEFWPGYAYNLTKSTNYNGQWYYYYYSFCTHDEDAGGQKVLRTNYGGEFWGDPDNVRWRFVF